MKSSEQAGRVAGVGDAAVSAKTGKTWSEWFAILDAAGAAQMNHQQIVAYLSQQQQVGPWWQQMLTVGYEQARGLRAKHQTPEGFQISASKTIDVPIGTLFKAWQDEPTRSRWLRRAVTIRKATPKKSLRLDWAKGKSSVNVNFYAKGASKSQVTLEHSRLAGAAEAARMKAFWTKALLVLKEQLEA
ncbi:MAG TPA: hypothetical protein VJG32_06460 [Anaerolineae bacterium]|nr:hypothetical protein [Anaerolineae bacterium]